MESNKELSECFNKAYQETLSKYHSFLIRPVFALAMKACPSRVNFFKSLGGSEMDSKLISQFNKWRSALEGIVFILIKFYNQIS